ncbi:MAG: hypothetical protein ACQESA_03470 [Patescibacteria group bacterium]
MIPKNKSFFKELSKNTKDIIFSPYPRPKRDWLFILSFFFIVLFITAAFNSSVFLYYEYFYETLDEKSLKSSVYEKEVGDEQDGLNLNKEELNKVWGFFDSKEERFDLIKNSWRIRSPLQKDLSLESEEESENTEEEGEVDENRQNEEPEEGFPGEEEVFEL